MEEQQVILKIFRALAEEEEEYITQGDSEITCKMKKNDDRGFEEILTKKGSLSWLLLPPAGEKFFCDSEEAENGPQVMNEERRTAGNGCESFGTEQGLNRQNERRNAAGDCEPEQDACQHISDCRYPDCVCAAALKQDDDDDDDAGEAEEEKQSDVGFGVKDASKSSSSSAEGLNTLAHTGPEAGEQHGSIRKPTLDQSDEHFYLKDANEERSGAEEEGRNREIEGLPFNISSPKHASLNITRSDMARNPPPGSTISRATYSPGSPSEKHIQLPALFSGLRVLKKGVLGPEQDSVASRRPSPQRPDGEILPGKGGEAKGSILEQISNFLSRERRGEEEEKEEDGERRQVQSEEDADAPSEPLKPVSSAEAAFDAFKAFFTPKPLKRDPREKVDLEAVRKRIKAERDALRALYEGTSVKSSEQKEPSDHQVGMTCYGRQHTFN